MFEKSLQAAGSGNYLGDVRVVTDLVEAFIKGAAEARSPNEVFALVNRYADIFLGLNDSYTPVEGWNDGQHLGRSVARYLSVDDKQSSVDVMRSGFGVLAREVMLIVKSSPGIQEKMIELEVDGLKRYMVAVLMGTADTLFPNGKRLRRK